MHKTTDRAVSQSLLVSLNWYGQYVAAELVPKKFSLSPMRSCFLHPWDPLDFLHACSFCLVFLASFSSSKQPFGSQLSTQPSGQSSWVSLSCSFLYLLKFHILLTCKNFAILDGTSIVVACLSSSDHISNLPV